MRRAKDLTRPHLTGLPMSPQLQVLVGFVILFLLVGIVWRLSARCISKPCPSWLAWLFAMDNPYAKDYNANGIIQRLDLKPGMRVLDAGCGPGRVTIPLAKDDSLTICARSD